MLLAWEWQNFCSCFHTKWQEWSLNRPDLIFLISVSCGSEVWAPFGTLKSHTGLLKVLTLHVPNFLRLLGIHTTSCLLPKEHVSCCTLTTTYIPNKVDFVCQPHSGCQYKIWDAVRRHMGLYSEIPEPCEGRDSPHYLLHSYNSSSSWHLCSNAGIVSLMHCISQIRQ